jgi:hypothetical protein
MTPEQNDQARQNQERILVDRGVVLHSRIKALTAELASITVDLIELARAGKHVPLEDESREGTQYIATGTDRTIPVVFTADLVAKSFKDLSPAHARVDEAAKGHLPEFFKKKTIWERIPKDGKALRLLAAATLEKDAPAFISACLQRDKHGTPKSAVKVQWSQEDEAPETTEEAE